MPSVQAIFICPEMGDKMELLEKVNAIEGAGLEGDRYATGKGAYSKSKPPKIRHVSFISEEAIAIANADLEDKFLAQETRRNILTIGIDLNSLVGKKFRIGDVEFLGIELCDPCDRPTKLAGKTNFKSAFENKGGLRAEILSSGEICVGDDIIIL